LADEIVMKTIAGCKWAPRPRVFHAVLVGVAALNGLAPVAAQDVLYISHIFDNRVSKYNADGTPVNASFVTGLDAPFGIALSANGASLYVANLSSGSVGHYDALTGDAINASLITGTPSPRDVVLFESSLYVGNNPAFPGKISKYTTTGALVNENFITGLADIRGMALSDDGNMIYILNAGAVGVYDAITGATINGSLISGFLSASDIVASGSNLYVADGEANTIGQFTTAGTVVNPALITGLNDPRGIALSGNGTSLFVVNFDDGSVGHYDAVTGAALNAALITGLSNAYSIIVAAADIPGDFDDDGDVDVTDYLTLVANLHTDVGSLTTEQSYLQGDMTRDLQLNGRDFLAFAKAYDDANGLAAFTAMLAALPEPPAGCLAAWACLAFCSKRTGRRA
jgi:DNA-binding beta-propeller fold protein YncE